MATFPILTSDGDTIVTSDTFAVAVEDTSPPPSIGTMKQIIHGKTYGDIGSGEPVTTLRGNFWSNEVGGEAAAVFKHRQLWSVAGSFSHLYVEILAPVENAAALSWDETTFTLQINGVDTALTCTVPAMGPIAQNGFMASASDTTHTVTVAPGDIVAIHRSPALTIHENTNAEYAHMDWTLTFESENAGESGYGAGSAGSRINSDIQWCALLNNQESAFVPVAALDSVSQTELHSIVPLIGSLYRIDLQLELPPGVGSSWTFRVYKNGVKQDGSGGTVDTTLVIADLATTGTVLFDLPLVPLDFLTLRVDVQTGATASTYIIMGCAFRAATNGQSALCFNSAAGHPVIDGSTDWAAAQESGWAWTTPHSPTPTPAWRPTRWPSTELLVSLPGAIDPYTLSGFCVNLNAAPGSAKSYLFTTRKAFADTVSTVTLSGTTSPASLLQTDPLNASVDYTTITDRLNIECVGSGTPTAASVAWTWLMTTEAVPNTATTFPIRRLRRWMP
jgi:hypothetical protein